jgi:acyl-coenzyme A synthetase/AMP-(fatty) acid ligase
MTNTGDPILPSILPFKRETINQSVPARFEHVVAQAPDQIALTGDGRVWTYAELNRQANRIAHAIKANTKPGIGCVAILANQSPEMVIATLAVTKTGKVYFGIHPGLPPAAQLEILKDAAPDLILSTASLAHRAREIAPDLCPTLVLEGIDEFYSEYNPESSCRPQDPLAIFYTSGTTGQPKGVVKSHGMIMHRVWLSTKYDLITATDRQSLLTHCAYSASEADIFAILLQGGTLCVLDIASKGLKLLI